MTAQQNDKYLNLNHLRRGAVYRAITAAGVTLGEYLGMEAIHGEHAILLRTSGGTTSIPRHELLSIEASI